MKHHPRLWHERFDLTGNSVLSQLLDGQRPDVVLEYFRRAHEFAVDKLAHGAWPPLCYRLRSGFQSAVAGASLSCVCEVT